VVETADTLSLLAASSDPWWLTTFRPFGFQHFVPAGLALVAMATLAAVGYRHRGSPGERRVRLAIAWASFAYAITVSVWYLIPPKLNLARSLPLHMCDLMVLIAPLALITGNRTLRTLNCFWGVALCSQAFITPILTVGLDDAEYYFFWTSHAVIVGSSLYDYIAGRYRPTLRDFGVCVGWGVVWVVAVFLINLVIDGANYGYVGKPVAGQPTIVDKLGEWPLRAVLVALIAIAGCGLIYLGSLAFQRFEGPAAAPRRWPSIATLVAFFSIGVAMLIAGAIDARDPTPPGPRAR
jgi:hypothetical integral membrane protein (TIGR02206 family)